MKPKNNGDLNLCLSPGKGGAKASLLTRLRAKGKLLWCKESVREKVSLRNRLKEIAQNLSDIGNIPSKEARVLEMLFELLT